MRRLYRLAASRILRHLNYVGLSLAIAIITFVICRQYAAAVLNSDSIVKASKSDVIGGVIVRDPNTPCGATCVWLSAALLGTNIDLDAVRSLLKPDPMGRNSLAEVDDTLRHLGFETSAVRLTWRQLSHVTEPCILHLRNGHFVVGISTKDSRVLIVDPPREPRFVSQADLKQWDGVSLLVGRNREQLAYRDGATQ